MNYREIDWLAEARRRAASFWSRVDKHGPYLSTPHGFTPCWLWTGASDTDGYGTWTVAVTTGDGRKYHCFRAHRLSAQLAGVDLSPDVGVLHQCDNPACVNPGHFRYGTQAENMAEKSSRGRAPHKITDDEVDLIRRSRLSPSVLAERHGVSTTHVRMIRRNQRRSGVG